MKYKITIEVDVLESRVDGFEPNFAGILESIQFFRQQGSRNAQSQTSNTGDQTAILDDP